MATVVEQARTDRPVLDVERLREDFPALALSVHGRPLAYLDNAATAQKPLVVLDAEHEFYRTSYANVHRGVHHLAEKATQAYERSREIVARSLNASAASEIVFTRGTTESVNLVASSFVRPTLKTGDEVLISHMEHHSNIVPWQLLCEEKGAHLRVAPIDDRGDLEMGELEALISERTRILSIVHVSNALGTVNPIREIVELAHSRGVPVLVDGAQAVPHMKVDVRELGCDFYAFSSHKAFGPTGVGALFGQAAHLEAMPPYQGGGEMIRTVSFDKTEFAEPPFRFEAGTPNIAGTVGFGVALEYIESVGYEAIAAHEHALLEYATQALAGVEGLRMIGTARHKAGVLSFVLDGVHAHDIGTILDREGVAVRTGHHCAQPVMERFEVAATARASLAFYNTRDEVDRLVSGLGKVREVFG